LELSFHALRLNVVLISYSDKVFAIVHTVEAYRLEWKTVDVGVFEGVGSL